MRLISILIAAVSLAPSSVCATITDADLEAALKRSEDLSMHAEVFLKASRALVLQGQCSLQDFRIIGGWARRMASGREQHRIYVTYCGGTAAKNRLYLDVTSGRVFR